MSAWNNRSRFRVFTFFNNATSLNIKETSCLTYNFRLNGETLGFLTVNKSSFVIKRDASWTFCEEWDLAGALVFFVNNSCVSDSDSTNLCSLVSFYPLIDHLDEFLSFVVTGISVYHLVFLHLLENPFLHFPFSLAILFIYSKLVGNL